MNAEELNSKFEITEAALDLYEKDRFNISNLVDATGLTASDIYSLFPNKKSILTFYYEGIVLRYYGMISEIDDFGSYTLSEKLSNFIYTSFDLMDERKAFVDATFDQLIFRKTNISFNKEVTELFAEFIRTDPNIAVSAAFLTRDYFFEFLAKEYQHVLKFYLKDSSEGKERSMALTDKLTGFTEELLYNKIVDKGFDLAKYLFAHAGLGKKIPIVGDCITDYFREKKTDD